MARELEMLGGVLDDPRTPVVAIVGGAKISTKVGVLDHLLDRVDILWVGGAMACTFYRALGESTGTSLVEEEQVADGTAPARRAPGRRADLRLPLDGVVAERATDGAPTQVVAWKAIPDGWMVVDAGPDSVAGSPTTAPARAPSSGTVRSASTRSPRSRPARGRSRLRSPAARRTR